MAGILYDEIRKIEELREKLYELLIQGKLTDDKVIKVSKQLDSLLVEYQKLIQERQEHQN